jgi:hypothetical protein
VAPPEVVEVQFLEWLMYGRIQSTSPTVSLFLSPARRELKYAHRGGWSRCDERLDWVINDILTGAKSDHSASTTFKRMIMFSDLGWDIVYPSSSQLCG